MRGVAKFLDWLANFPGDTWQQRWLASGQEESSGADWARLPTEWLTARGESANSGILVSGLLMLICAEVIRPSMTLLLSRGSCTLATGMAQYRDGDGFATLDQVIADDPTIIKADAQPAKARIAVILASKGGRITDITVGDCVEFYETHSKVRPAGAPGKTLFYVLLHRSGVFGADAPATLRTLCGRARGQMSTTELVDRYRLQPGPVRGLIIDFRVARTNCARPQPIPTAMLYMKCGEISARSARSSAVDFGPSLSRRRNRFMTQPAMKSSTAW
ncbi:hypothetical protein ACWDKQ_36280 [Saccharopolyspora sp. NPDC000995]